jgi:two-component system nitrate/nitrite response regulator NarL
MDTGSAGRPVTVALVDDQEVVLEGVRSWIERDPRSRAEIIAAGDSVRDVLENGGRDADVLVLDLDLGQEWKLARLNEVTSVIAGLCDGGSRVVVFSIHVEPLVVQAVISAGARVFIDKHAERGLFVDTVVAVGRDQPVVTPSTAGGMLHELRPEIKLADREKEALRYLFQGMSYQSIAFRMVKDGGGTITKATVREYIDRARAKFAAAGRPSKSTLTLLARCVELGLITTADVDEYRSRAASG